LDLDDLEELIKVSFLYPNPFVARKGVVSIPSS
jgi:hypothetical protein